MTYSDTKKTPDYANGEGMGDDAKKKRNFWKPVKYILYFVCGVMAARLLVRALSQYLIAFEKWGLFENSETACRAISGVWIVGGFLQELCFNLASTAAAILPYAALVGLTIMQSIATLLVFCPGAIEGMVLQLRANMAKFSHLGAETTDTEEIGRLVKRHKKAQENNLKTLLAFSILAFIAEAFIIWVARDGQAEILDVLVDSLAFDALFAFVLILNNLFKAESHKNAKRYQGS